MQSAQLFTLTTNVGEDLGTGRIGNAREIYLQKLGIGLAIIRRMEDAIDVVEHLDLAGSADTGRRTKVIVRPSLVFWVDFGNLADCCVEFGVEVCSAL